MNTELNCVAAFARLPPAAADRVTRDRCRKTADEHLKECGCGGYP
jgi:hypothetical protein